MLRKIKLYGSLAKFVGKRVLYADVESAAEAVRFLIANWPEVRGHMSKRYYQVKVDNFLIQPDGPELSLASGSSDIKIIPVTVGASDAGDWVNNVIKAVVGVVLIVVSIVFPVLAPVLMPLGVGLLLGGVAGMLSPSTPLDGPLYDSSGGAGSGSGSGSGGSGNNTSKDARKSYSFSNVQNVSRQGIAIPVVYGETVVGSIVASAGISAVRKKK